MNWIRISGAVSERHNSYVIIKSERKSGEENIIRVWDLPKEVSVGDNITVMGKLDTRRLGKTPLNKIILGRWR